MVSSKEEVQADLAPYLRDFVACVRGALEDYADKYKEMRHALSKRSQASVIHDHLVHRLTERFGTLRDAEGKLAVHRKGNLRQLVFEYGKYKIRLKKHDLLLRTRNIPTQAVLNFKWQQQSFEQVKPSTNLTLGYQLASEASVTDAVVLVTCPNGNGVSWSWELEFAKSLESVKSGEVLPFEPAKRRRVKPKKSATPKKAPSKAEGDDAGSTD